MHINTKEKGKVYITHLNGDLDFSSVEDLEAVLDNILNLSDIKGLIFDMEKMGFVDSTGVGHLLNYCHQLEDRLIPYYFTNVHTMVNEVFDLIGLRSVVGDDRFQPSLEEAERQLIGQ